jgi:hypothetical protein
MTCNTNYSKCLQIMSFLAVFLCITTSGMADDCGSKEGRLNQVATDFVIPDYFPPDSPVLRALIEWSTSGTVGRCENLFGRASLKPACRAHDRCYETFYETKGRCDEKLLHDWEEKCKRQYRNRRNSPDNFLRTACREACVKFIKLMSEAQKFNEAGYCPSCKAWLAAKGSYAVRTWTDRYASANNAPPWQLHQVPHRGPGETFIIERVDENSFAIKTWTNMYVSANNAPPWQLHQVPHRGAGETFLIERVDGNHFAIKTWTNMYVSANNAPPWQLHQVPHRGPGETFIIERVD